MSAHEVNIMRRKAGLSWEPKAMINKSENSHKSTAKQRLSTKSFSFGGTNEEKPQEAQTQYTQTSDTPPKHSFPHYVTFYETENPKRSRSTNANPISESSSESSTLTSPPKERRVHNKKGFLYRKKMIERKTTKDASTQTTNDVGTQTSDDENLVRKHHNEEIPVGKETIAFEPFAFSHKKSPKVKKVIVIEDQKKKEAALKGIEEDILSNLHDLEDEIARIRYRALTVQEALKWLNREKSEQRPVNPVLSDLDTIPTKDVKNHPPVTYLGAIPIRERSQSEPVMSNKDQTGKEEDVEKLEIEERELGMPVFKPISSLTGDVQLTSPELRRPTPTPEPQPQLNILGPNPAKRISIGSDFSAFSSSSQRMRIKRVSKSMGHLDDLRMYNSTN